ncbi:hypothetical protein FCH28_27565 [Streptomyces piniterrae]|uniref:Uncharacterized protein n=1 Tax=Streptomyces piniterrae TaxID=2571125 RepID=A0A4U0MZS9_9ACTN|nr:hypothetical protein [Streptomyces piniterrae]TJZ46252.1 hypothetical protein FCH28_27565 [Streptomyces piniterrae]
MTVLDVVSRLPDVPVLRDLCRSLAMLDAILSPDHLLRSYSFDRRWGPSQEMASMDNGQGDDFSLVLVPAGACLRGFDHESPMSPYAGDADGTWPGICDGIPDELRSAGITEPAFCDEDGLPRVTACVWRTPDSPVWRAGDIDFPQGHPDPDGSDRLFRLLLDPTPDAYHAFAQEYHGARPELSAVQHLYALRPLTPEIVMALNPEVTLDALSDDIESIGYPHSATPEGEDG